MAESVEEYQSQLNDVVALLQESPEDQSLLSLKADLEELIAITSQQESQAETASAAQDLQDAPQQPHPVSVAAAIDAATDRALASARGETEIDATTRSDNKRGIDYVLEGSETAQAPAKKASKKIAVEKEFVVPSGLIVLDTDTDAEKHRKHRAIKSLKSKWREKKKEAETQQKQKSWQSFQKKKKSSVKDTSMFSTAEGDPSSKVGVVSAGNRQLTHGGDRKRHKY